MLNFLIDSIGIKLEGEGEWNVCKYGGLKCWIWCKIYIGIDEEILEVWVVEVIISNVGDVLMLFELLN